VDDRPDLGLDLAAASIRADEPELARAMEAFAARLESALPAATRVRRRGRWPWSREGRVAGVDVELGEVSFRLSVSRHGVVAERTEQVHDMSRRTERLELADWLRSLEDALRERASSSAEARAALEELLER
jgi:hypothetical protein